jgi:hypothetical protein
MEARIFEYLTLMRQRSNYRLRAKRWRSAITGIENRAVHPCPWAGFRTMKMSILMIISNRADDSIYIWDARRLFFQCLLPFDGYFVLRKAIRTLDAQN